MQNPLEGLASTAMEMSRLNQDLKNAKAQEKQLRAQTKKTDAETELIKNQAPKSEATSKPWMLLNKVFDNMMNTSKSKTKLKKYPNKTIQKPTILNKMY